MTTYFISRHPGAIEWARHHALPADCQMAHLEPDKVQPGDTVIGSLPVNLAAQVCAAGAVYVHLSLELPAHLRGQELSAVQLDELGATLQAYRIEPVTSHFSSFAASSS